MHLSARAEAALLLIDALEGVKEQSKKHGYLLSLLGVRQFAVVVNKMDLVGYDQAVFETIDEESRAILRAWARGERPHAPRPDVVVVDEASMMDLTLSSHLFAALPPRASLILVGDVDMLADATWLSEFLDPRPQPQPQVQPQLQPQPGS